MRKTILPLVVFVVAIGIALVMQAAYIVNERQQAIVLQFGEHVRTVQTPGLYFKIPFIQNVFYTESRILLADGRPEEYLTLDKKRLLVDHISRWRIVDPLVYYQRLRTEEVAVARLQQVIASQLREEIARHEFITVIREEREAIMENVARASRPAIAEFGIELLDVRIKRLDLPSEVQESVFARMEAERNRIALRYRAEGEEAARQIRAQADKEREIILATAQEQAERIRGEGDARATAIYAAAYGEDPEFYAFLRRLEAYERILGDGATLVLDAESDLLRFLESTK